MRLKSFASLFEIFNEIITKLEHMKRMLFLLILGQNFVPGFSQYCHNDFPEDCEDIPETPSKNEVQEFHKVIKIKF